MDYQDTPEFWEWFVRAVLVPAAQSAAAAIGGLRGTAGAGIAAHDSHSGDIVTRADVESNRAIRAALQNCPIPLALLDEERGVLEQLHENAKVGLIVDELDGTRPFRMGMATACVSIAAWPLAVPAELRNVRCGLLLALDTGAAYFFVRGRGVWRSAGSSVTNLAAVNGAPSLRDACLFLDAGIVDFGLHGLYMRPFEHAGKIGAVQLSACCYGGVLMVEGGAHAMIIIGYREWRSFPAVQDAIRRVWGRFEPGPQTYDVAALVPLLLEMGCTVTSSFGRSLDSLQIDRSGTGNECPGLIAARSAALHATIMSALDEQERYLLAHRAEVEAVLQCDALGRREPESGAAPA